MYVKFHLMLQGDDMEFGSGSVAAKRVIAAYLRAAAERLEALNDSNIMSQIEDDDTGAVVGYINLAIIGGGV